MVGLETALKIGSSLATIVIKPWIEGRKKKEGQSRSLSEAVDDRVTDLVIKRGVNRRIEQIADSAAKRFLPYCTAELPEVPRSEQDAALLEVVSTLQAADLSDTALFEADLDASQLVSRVRHSLPLKDRVGLSEAGERYYNLLLDECASTIVQMAIHLPQIQGRVSAEILQRLSNQAEKLEIALGRMPIRTLDAPHGEDLDGEFREQYYEYLSNTLDDLELFGVDTRNYRPKTSLSVAYISLSVTTNKHSRSNWVGERRLAENSTMKDSSTVTSVESAIGHSRRVLLRGEAGSGKSTLLRWLAITAVRGGFGEALNAWNGATPFLIKLRSYADGKLPRPEQFLDISAESLVGIMPRAWVHRRLKSGHAMLLVDGVDELPSSQRVLVRKWLTGLLASYPSMKIVVTSRPGAAKRDWLDQEGFVSAELEKMTPSDVRTLINHWHIAIDQAGNLPCDSSEIPRYERALISRLESNRHLSALATSPLLCTMLCALNLDRDTQLPRNRLGLYEAAIELLVDRRDSERHIPSARIEMDSTEKAHLLQKIAWWLARNGRAEMPGDLAASIVSSRLSAMPSVKESPPDVVDFLVQRSGVIREPVVGRIDFIHKTFQDYLAASEAAQQSDVGILVKNAHLDSWRDIVVMAAGLGNAWVKQELFEGILSRISSDVRNARKLKLVAASCLETVRTLEPPELLERINDTVNDLVPPKSTSEARSLARVGERVIPLLPENLEGLTWARAHATIQAAAWVNGEKALDLLRKYMKSQSRTVRHSVLATWRYFDSASFATKVISGNRIDDLVIPVQSLPQIGALSLLNGVQRISFTSSAVSRISQISHIPEDKLLSLVLRGNSLDFDHKLDSFAKVENLQLDYAQINGPFVNELKKLTHLRQLFIDMRSKSSVNFLDSMNHLYSLRLYGVRSVTNWEPISRLESVRVLHLGLAAKFDLDHLRGLKNLNYLVLHLLDDFDDRSYEIIRDLEGIRTLILGGKLLGNVSRLASLPRMRVLYLYGLTPTNISCLEDLPMTRAVSAVGVSDLGRFKALSQLESVMLDEPPDPVDLKSLENSSYRLFLTGRVKVTNMTKAFEGRVWINGNPVTV